MPRIATPMGTLPGLNELPTRTAMPDVMVMNNGTRVTAQRQWEARRQEMKRVLWYYAVGQMNDWTAMLDFFDTHLRGRPSNRTFDRFPTEQELDAALAAAAKGAP